MISIIAAVARNGAIGYDNRLIYWLPDDLRRFKALTTGHTIVMGRRTFESLPKGALPNRRNIVLSRSGFSPEGAEVFPSLDEALCASAADDEVFIIGGASIYRQLLPYSNKVLLTKVHANGGAEVFFPNIDENPNFRCISKQPPIMDERSIEIEFTTYANDGTAPLRYEKARGKTVEMNLCDGPFQAIKEGFKDIEMRLFDEKRADLEVGDVIIFTNLATGEKLSRTVIALAPFDSFETLYAAFPKSRLGYRDDEVASPKDMEQYYSAERIAKYGPLAIFLE